MKRIFFFLLLFTVLFSFTGCGTLFHSERLGRPMTKEIDRSVWAGDCALLLLGIVPGIVAYTLDYDNETIYYTKVEQFTRQRNQEKQK